MKLLSVLGLMLCLSACSGKTISAAHDAIKHNLKDPYSAQFRKDTLVTFSSEGTTFKIVCGEVNAKNGFGAYAGHSLYMVVMSNTSPVPYLTEIMEYDQYIRMKSFVTEDRTSVTIDGYVSCIEKMRAIYE